MLREATAAGRRFSRVRVVSLPLTDYSRFGVWCAQFTKRRGEDIRYLPRPRPRQPGCRSHDYWLFDSRKLVRMHFDDNDAFLGGELVDDPEEIVSHNYWRDAARHHARRRDDFAAEQHSAASNVHEARNALGRRLRELRQAAGLSGRQLAEHLSWPPSKVSKLENGRQTPTDDDIRHWTRATGHEADAEALLASLHTLEVQHAEWQRILQAGIRPASKSTSNGIRRPGSSGGSRPPSFPASFRLPSTPTPALPRASAAFSLPDDVDEAVAAECAGRKSCTGRTNGSTSCSPKLPCATGSARPSPARTLDRLMSFAHCPTSGSGSSASQTPYSASPWHGFWIVRQRPRPGRDLLGSAEPAPAPGDRAVRQRLRAAGRRRQLRPRGPRHHQRRHRRPSGRDT